MSLDPGYFPKPGKPLPAAGVQGIAFAVTAEHSIEAVPTREVCRRPGMLGLRPPVRLARDLADVVRDAVANELRSHDLRVVAGPSAQAILHIEPIALTCTTGADRSQVLARLEGDAVLIDPGTGSELRRAAIAAPARIDSVFFTRADYQAALELALGEFARRVVRHPDLLIALQELAAGKSGP